jgi:tRNA 2-selenouridine synthase
MRSEFLAADQFETLLLAVTPIIDVRAPVEFLAGSIPGSVNLPIMNDEERAQVGTTYKQKGQEAAVALGHQLVAGAVKEERVQAWVQFIRQNPTAVLTCFRGGLRSGTAQAWLVEQGIECPRIQGGYKVMRQFLLENIQAFCQSEKLNVISGATGSGKTLLLRSLKSFRKTADLELWAHHRGSAFGGYADGQPAQIDFENRLSLELLRNRRSQDRRATLIEDESRLVGRSVQPEALFDSLRASPVVMVEEPIASRVEVTYQDYILDSALGSNDEKASQEVYTRYLQSLQKISKKLGGLRTQEVLRDLQNAHLDHSQGHGLDAHKVWIEKLLVYYYDPLYFGSLERRSPTVVFRGSRSSCFGFLKNEL